MGKRTGRALDIRVLGPLEVRIDDQPVDLPRGRVRALTVALALSAGQPVPVETLTERVWGDHPPMDGRACLHTAVMRLRRVLGADVISRGGGGYTLDVAPDRVDALRFEHLLDRAESGPDPFAELRLLRSALAHWRAEPAEQHLSDWLTKHEWPRLVERYLTGIERAADLELRLDNTADLTGELRRLTEQYPLRESLWVRLMRALAGTGRTAEALTSYQSVRVRLADELGVDPGPELLQTYAELLAATEPRAVVPNQLPADVDGFIGRGAVLRSLDELATTGLAIVHGTGGVGKTTLAVHWGHRVRADFADGQLFVNLRGFGPGAPVEPAAALVTLLVGLGVPSEQIPDDLEARGALFRTVLAGRRVLVVLDNARDAQQVRPLLPGTGPTVLVTSRNELRGLAARERGRRVALDVLPRRESVALLGDRVRAHAIDHDETSLARLAELCGHLPLALSVVAERAGRHPGRPLGELARQLDDEHARLDLLETGEDPSTSLRAVMSWSYRALDPDAARLFRLLGLHPSVDIGTGAAAALTGVEHPAAVRLLDRLVENHLARSPAPGRYTMHDLIHAYAAERSTAHDPPADRAAAIRRLYQWYARSARGASVAVWGSQAGSPDPGPGHLTFDDDRQAMAWFATEQHTLLAVITGSMRLGLHEEVIGLVRAVSVYQDLSRVPVEIRPLLEQALASARAVRDEQAEAHLLILLGRHHQQLGELDLALPCFESAHMLHRRLDDATGVCAALGNIAIIHRKSGNHPKAIRYLERSIEHARGRDLHDRAAASLNTLAAVYRDIGRYADAEVAATEAVRLWRVVGLPLREGIAIDSLASVYLLRGDHELATVHYRQAIDIFRGVGSGWWLAWTLRNLGRALLRTGDTSAARASWDEALHTLDEIGAADNAEISRSELRGYLTDPGSAAR